jgi:subtilisin family serine protease
MKSHLVIKLSRAAPLPRGPIPHWQPFIRDKSHSVEVFEHRFDDEMHQHGLRFWVTQEYSSAGHGWSDDEIKAGFDRIFRIILQGDAGLPPWLISRIRLNPSFESVHAIEVGDAPQPVRAASLNQIPADRSRERIGQRAAHLFGEGDPRVKVAILDTGVDSAHPELAHAIEAQADFVNLDGLDTTGFIGDISGYDQAADDEVGHGTHVAGIIAARGDKIPKGVAPACRIIAVRTLAAMRDGGQLVGAGIVDNINVAIKWAVDAGADVINASLGIRHAGGGLPHEEVIAYALSRGVTVVAASGNDGTSEKYYPGALAGVIAVGAADHDREVAPFSSYGADVSLIAPGTSIISTDVHHGYKIADGTSQASPFVAGACALLRAQALARGSRLTDADVKELLVRTCDQPRGPRRTPRRGYGHLNLADACRLLDHGLRASGNPRSRSDGLLPLGQTA